jgi:uncharacterized protein (TIGR00288 family)
LEEKLTIAVFVDYDNIEIGVKSTLQRDFDVSLALDAFKERGDIVAKFAYANWSRQESATRRMAENAVQMVQRIPSPRGDKNGADINLALDALEMAFTHEHVNAFAIISGDSDFIPLVNKLKEYGKTVYVLGGKAFTSTILQQNCHEFISYESLLSDGSVSAGPTAAPAAAQGTQSASLPGEIRDRDRRQHHGRDREPREQRGDGRDRGRAPRAAPLDLAQAMPLVERALQVLERRAVQPQLGLLKSTMLQLDPAFSEKAYGAGSFSDFVEKLKKADFVEVSGTGGRYIIERKGSGGAQPERATRRPEESLPLLRDVLEVHRLEVENGASAEQLEQWMQDEHPAFAVADIGFQEFAEFLNYAQDKLVVRLEPDEDKVTVYLGAEFYPPALPERPPEPTAEEEEEEEKQPIVPGQPSMFEPNPPPVPEPAVRKRAPRTQRTPRPRKTAAAGNSDRPRRQPRKKKTD